MYQDVINSALYNVKYLISKITCQRLVFAAALLTTTVWASQVTPQGNHW